jgi:predicted PhzF superfamily epimerase YddE/YHI9
MGHELPLAITVDQGELVGRRCRLGLDVSESGVIRVTGRVVEIGRGEITL